MDFLEAPPFAPPPGKSGPWVRVAFSGLSDGNPRYWPGSPPYREADERICLMKLGEAWVEDQRIGEKG